MLIGRLGISAQLNRDLASFLSRNEDFDLSSSGLSDAIVDVREEDPASNIPGYIFNDLVAAGTPVDQVISYIRENDLGLGLETLVSEFSGQIINEELASENSYGVRLSPDQAMSDLVAGRISERPDLNELAADLVAHPWGNNLARRQGLDFLWTDMMFDEGLIKLLETGAPEWVDTFLLSRGPAIIATRERFYLFKKMLAQLIQDSEIRSGDSVMTIPAGRGRDVLEVERTLERGHGIRFVGVDKSQRALDGYRELARKMFTEGASTLHRNALEDLGIAGEVAAAFSNGLQIYLSDEETLQFYGQVFSSLRAGAPFVTSGILTPPEWNVQRINQDDLEKQVVIMRDVIQPGWKSRTLELNLSLLRRAGFEINSNVGEGVFFDPNDSRLFPMFLARKPR